MIAFLALVIAASATVPKNSEAMAKYAEKFLGGLMEKFPHGEAGVKRSAAPTVDKEALVQKWREAHPHGAKPHKASGVMDDAKMAELIEKYKASRPNRGK